MHDFQGYFFRTFCVLEFLRKKIQDFPRGMGTLTHNHRLVRDVRC